MGRGATSQRGIDLYQILGVPRDADGQAIKDAYKALALEFHPDKNPDNQIESEVKFKAVGQAYDILSDPRKREIYDAAGGGAQAELSMATRSSVVPLCNMLPNEGGKDTLHDVRKLFSEFVDDYELDGRFQLDGVPSDDHFSTALRLARDVIMEQDCDSPVAVLRWMPDYGAAILRASFVHDCTRLQISVLGCDGWSFGVHPGPGRHPTATPGHTPALQHCGSIHPNDLKDFEEHFSELLRKAQANTGQERHADNPDKGHQKTPAFVFYLCSAAVQKCNPTLPVQEDFGGFTDVGRHTGGTARDTALPLVTGVLHVVLHRCTTARPAAPGLAVWFEYTLARFALYVAERVGPDRSDLQPFHVNAVMQLLVKSERIAISLVQSSCPINMVDFLAFIESLKNKMQQKVDELAESVADQFVLAPISPERTSELCNLPSPILNVPDAATSTVHSADINMDTVWCNLDFFLHLPKDATFAQALTWIKGTPNHTSAHRQSIIAQTEQMILSFALRLPSTGSEDTAPLLNEAEIRAMVQLSDLYRGILGKFCNALPQNMMRTKLKSAEILVIWTEYCLIHQTAKYQPLHTMLSDFAVALDYHDLEHLVLADKLYIDAMLAVSDYLKRYKAGPVMFSGRGSEWNGTLRLADSYACVANSPIPGIWRNEKREADKREEERYEIVKKQQRRCAELREEIRELEAKWDAADRRYQNAPNHWEEAEALRERNRYAQRKNNLNWELQAQLKPPSVLYQPLPDNPNLAKRALFFCFMTPLFQALARTSFEAYQLLTTSTPECLKAINNKWSLNSNMIDHFYQYSSSTAGLVKSYWCGGHLEPQIGKKPNKLGASSVDDIFDSRNGVWHPNGIRDALPWRGGLYRFEDPINPFHFHRPSLVTHLTEQLPSHRQSMQWAMEQPGMDQIDAKRGNFPLSKQSERDLSWLPKPAFLAFGALRAYPLQQIRKIATLLHDDTTLPLTDPEVHTLIKQAMYHIGGLDGENGPTKMVWKQDLLHSASCCSANEHQCGVAILCSELQRLAEMLRHTPARHEAVLLLGELASFLSQFEGGNREVSRAFAQIALDWANDLSQDIKVYEEACDAHKVALCRAQQQRFLIYALICHKHGQINADDAAMMCALQVRICRAEQLIHDVEDASNLGDALMGPAKAVMASRIGHIKVHVSSHMHMLNEAVRYAVSAKNVPDSLTWKEIQSPAHPNACCFEATPSSTIHLSVNLLNGIVLMNGVPPSHLPIQVLQHKLYQRTFGERNFSVETPSPGHMRSTEAVGGRYYEFFVDTHRLTIVEEFKDAPPPHRFTLMDSMDTQSTGKWGGGVLPEHLRSDMFSHWYSTEKGGILLVREPLYSQHRVHYLYVSAEQSLFRVPEVEQLYPVARLIERGKSMYDRMVVQNEAQNAYDALSKFEPTPFIHPYSILDGDDHKASHFKIHMPRYNLEFELKQDANELYHFYSLDHIGYRLAERQQFDDTLLGFWEYLVLVHAHTGAVRIVIPRYSIQRQPNHSEVSYCQERVFTSVTKSATAVGLQTAVFNVHPRLQLIKASCISDRLKLASLYAATGTLLPERRTGMTGGEHAVELCRHSWVNWPLSQEERQNLDNLASFCDHIPILSLLCNELLQSSQTLSFLYDTEGQPKKETLEDVKAVTDYLQPTPLAARNYRMELRHDEQIRMLPGCGSVTRTQWTGSVAGFKLLPCDSLPADTKRAEMNELERWLPHDQFGIVHHAELLLRSLTNEPVEWSAVCSPAGSTLSSPSLPQSAVAHLETFIRDSVQQYRMACTTMAQGGGSTFPLECKGYPFETALGKSMVKDLQDSHSVYSSIVPQCLRQDLEFSKIDQLFGSLFDHVAAARKEIEGSIQAAVTHFGSLSGWDTQSCLTVRLNSTGRSSTPIPEATMVTRMLRCANELPTLMPTDMLLASWHPETLRQFNEALSDAAIVVIRRAILMWMELSVLEDRVARLKGYDFVNDKDQELRMIRELVEVREWRSSDHPWWLCFEVENSIQIRQEQHAIIQQLLDLESGAVSQLNMGLGKTRVIIPCLILEWTHSHQQHRVDQPLSQSARLGCIPRVVLLSQLLEEGTAMLHERLCGGVLGRKIFRLPFNRDVELNTERSQLINNQIRLCQDLGGAFIVAPEHRLSIILKSHELGLQVPCKEATHGADCRCNKEKNGSCIQLLATAEGRPWTEIFDEADEVFRPRRQLVYSLGTQEGMPDGSHRWQSVECLLYLCRHDPSVCEVLGRPHVSKSNHKAPTHCFNALELLPGKPMDDALPDLRLALVTALFTDLTPRPLAWIRKTPALKDAIIRFVLDTSTTARSLLGKHQLIQEGHYSDLLALRGLLAFGLLEHCLQRRHRVHYGAVEGRKKHLAIPFRAADTPALRSEFAQPDVALVMTQLSFYSLGLTMKQMIAAFGQLDTLGDSAKNDIYDTWFHLLDRNELSRADAQSIDAFNKIDVSNVTQRHLLYRVYAKHMLVIDFWLNSCVYPAETMVFPEKLMATPWHLADKSRAIRQIGFSGTNDGSILMPLSMYQASAPLQTIAATNGKMVAHIIAKSEYKRIPPLRQKQTAAIALASFLVGENVDVIIDVGAYFAGLSNEEVAQLLLKDLPPRFKGVCFFDSAVDKTSGLGGQWMVIDRLKRQWPLSSSPISAKDSFAFFDESRCRGSDLKLAENAKAMLTLSPTLCKDALMQAAGRMRGLDYGQTLLLAAWPEVDAMIRNKKHGLPDNIEVQVKHVLQFTLNNSIEYSGKALLNWSKQGVQFACTGTRTEDQFMEEFNSLEDMYEEENIEQTILQAYTKGISNRNAPMEDEGRAEATKPTLLERITGKMEAFGDDFKCFTSTHDEECERELEKEEEEEEEVERQDAKVEATPEVDWTLPDDVSDVHSITLPSPLKLYELKPFIQGNLAADQDLKSLRWPDGVYMTSNFCRPITARGSLNSFLRPLDMLLVFRKTEQLMLLSEREADRLLNWKFHSDKSRSSGLFLCNLCYLRDMVKERDWVPLGLSLPHRHRMERASLAGSPTFKDRLTAVLLFAGETKFVCSKDERKKGLRQLIPSKEAASAALQFAKMRGYDHMIDRSTLEKLCEDIVTDLHNAMLH